MSDVVLSDHRTPSATYAAPYCHVDGETWTAAAMPDGFRQFAVTGVVKRGTRLEWDARHGDEAVFVRRGSLAHGDTRLGDGDAIIVESGVITAVVAEEDTEVVHFGSTEPGTPTGGFLGVPQPTDHGVHLIHAATAPVTRSTLDDGTEITATWYADGVCRTCRIALLRVGSTGSVTAPSHQHSEDEVMCLLDGEMQVGPIRVERGMTVAIPAERRYGFRTKGAFEFINFRRAPCTVIVRPSDPSRLDLWNSELPPD